MSYNPYAAPSVEAYRAQPPPTGSAGEPRPWTVSEVISIGWSRIKDDGGPLVVASLLAQGIAGIPQQLPAILQVLGVVRQHEAAYWIIFGICSVVGFVIGAWLRGGIIRVWLASARGQKVDVGDVFKGGEFFWPILGAEMLGYLAALLGFCLLFFPGIYIALGFSLASTVVVDRRMGPMDALAESWRLMNGQRFGVFGFWMASLGLALAGMLACCMGILVVVPWIGVAGAVIYLRVSGQDDVAGRVSA